MKKNAKFFDEYGNFIGKIPDKAIEECSKGGRDAYYYVAVWVDILGFECPQELAKEYLQKFGAYEDLDKADESTINRRVFWLACCELNESGEFFGLE